MNGLKKTGAIEPAAIGFRTARDPHSHLPIPTATSIHEVRQAARIILARLRALQPEVGHRAFPGLRQSLRDLIGITAESRDAHVQRGVIARMQAAKPKPRARHYGELLLKLTRRRYEATLELARYLRSDMGAERMRQLNEDLSTLQVSQSSVNLPPLAAQRYRQVLRDIKKQLKGRITARHRVHPLRVKIRRARSLASMFEGAPGITADHLNHKLTKMQEALGDLRDATLLTRWIKKRGLTLAPQVKVALDSLVKRYRERCKACRRPLRHAVRRYLKVTRQ